MAIFLSLKKLSATGDRLSAKEGSFQYSAGLPDMSAFESGPFALAQPHTPIA
jgi:hypothetical protein